MRWKTIPFGVSMLIVSALGACGSGTPTVVGYPVLPLGEIQDPLVQPRDFTPWHPPRQMAAFVHPHEDPEAGVMIAGHWILVLLGEGSWYFEDPVDREPLPDREASPEDVKAALGALTVPRDAVIPFRRKEPQKP